MNEEILHHIWKYRLFDQNHLTTEQGELLEVRKTGEHNSHSGPDFFNANIKIGSTEWAGNVEIHVFSSDWEKHRHQFDKAYDSVILHVVYENDKTLYQKNKKPIPTLVLKDRLLKNFTQQYEHFKTSNDWIPCEKSIHRVPEFIVNSWLERLLIERLEKKSEQLLELLEQNNRNWEESFYQFLAHNFGFKINALPFELLSKSLPHSILAKHKNSLLQLEAMLFGNAGLLERQFEDKYLQQLQNEYQFLKNKFSLHPIDGHVWKFLRLRPANFPTIRLAQFAALIYQSEYLFSKILACESLETMHQLMNVQVSEYWKTHYVFEKKSLLRNKSLGKSAIDNLLINCIVPFLFIYGKQKQQEMYCERALYFLENTFAESNHIVTHFHRLGIQAKNASRSQALLQLKNCYCSQKNCLQCAVGNNLLKN